MKPCHEEGVTCFTRMSDRFLTHSLERILPRTEKKRSIAAWPWLVILQIDQIDHSLKASVFILLTDIDLLMK